jgi:hypothetical protein
MQQRYWSEIRLMQPSELSSHWRTNALRLASLKCLKCSQRDQEQNVGQAEHIKTVNKTISMPGDCRHPYYIYIVQLHYDYRVTTLSGVSLAR